MTPVSDTKRQRKATETRDAVETAIDMSKKHSTQTWEQQVKKATRITRWTEQRGKR